MRPVVPSRLGTPEATARSGDNPLYHPPSVGIRRYHPGHGHPSACWGRNGPPRPGTPEAGRGLADQRRRHRAARRSLRAVRWAARPRDRRRLEHTNNGRPGAPLTPRTTDGRGVAARAWTASARIGLGLMPVPLRNPALAAMEVATLARMFPGRFVPAAGHGDLAWMDQVGAGCARR